MMLFGNKRINDSEPASDLSRWDPSMIFKTNEFTYWDPVLQKTVPITWKFEQIEIARMPLAFVKCELECLGIKSEGWGDRLWVRRSMVQAFSEAWGRFWMKSLI